MKSNQVVAIVKFTILLNAANAHACKHFFLLPEYGTTCVECPPYKLSDFFKNKVMKSKFIHEDRFIEFLGLVHIHDECVSVYGSLPLRRNWRLKTKFRSLFFVNPLASATWMVTILHSICAVTFVWKSWVVCLCLFSFDWRRIASRSENNNSKHIRNIEHNDTHLASLWFVCVD